MARTTSTVMTDAKATLETARHGLSDLLGTRPERRLSGLRNLVVFGRAVTNVLQHLRGRAPSFDEWYESRVQEMQSDPLLKYFYKLRSIILKEGVLSISTSIYIEHLDTGNLFNRLPLPPPGASNFFIGDRVGGSGWEIRLPDGSTEKYYVELPADIGMVSKLHFPDAPSKHLDTAIEDTSIENLTRLYISYLDQLVAEAAERFLNN